jgi:ethanolamine utilization protein EutN
MQLGRVIGTVVACAIYQGMEGVKLLFVQPLDTQKRPQGLAVVCADATRQAGTGELVYIEGGREAAMALEPWFVPVDHAVIGIVDSLHMQEPG